MSNNDRATSPTKLVQRRQPASGRRKPDRRIERTRNRLGNALIALIQEKPIDEVTVREVLRRAGVGRSTFYVHYRDKDDLFLSELEQGLEMWSTTLSRQQESSNRVAPVAEFFAHVASAKRLYRALVDSGRIEAFFELAQGYFARGIEQRIKQSTDLRNPHRHELTACSNAFAGGLLSLLRWWLDRGAKESPRAMDELFHRMVWRGLQ
ncbi:MAG TPA: TetR/AcrR family transcriptional regulator [Bryobacteraceae bacterium]|nr:TetR/AcrR family transcriptional regulator [Bryobacteraceae bacterium]